MSHLISRRMILAALLSSAATQVVGQNALDSIRPEINPNIKPRKSPFRAPPMDIDEILSQLAPSGEHSFSVFEIDSKAQIEGHNSAKKLPPASVTKAATALYALRNLGSNFRFATQLVGSGQVQDGVLKGDLTLVGGSDPSMDTDGLANLAKALKAKGIRKVAGLYRYYDASLPSIEQIDPKQPIEVGYNPTISGLNLNFNRVYFQWARGSGGYQVSMTAKSRNYNPPVGHVKMALADRDLPVYTYKFGKDIERWSVARSALGGKGSRWLPVRNPSKMAADVFRELAAGQGIGLDAPKRATARPKGVVLAQETGAELNPMLRAMLKFSTNLTAETVGLTVSQTRGRNPQNLKDSGRSMSSWLSDNHLLKGAKFVDHSGLGDGARVASSEMAGMFARIGWDDPLRDLLKPVKLRDANWKAAPIGGATIVAKTGTLNFVSALAGYIEAPNGKRMAFAIFSADLKKRDAIKSEDRARPPGGRTWARQARVTQHALLRRWIKLALEA